jgi:hypothetical protein
MARRRYFNPDVNATSEYILRDDHDEETKLPYDDAAKWELRTLTPAEYGRVMDKSSFSRDADVARIPGSACVLAFELACVGWSNAGVDYSKEAKKKIDPSSAMEIGGEIINRSKITAEEEGK